MGRVKFVVFEKFIIAHYTKLQDKSCYYLLIIYMEKHHKKARQTKRQVWSDSVSAYVRAHVHVRAHVRVRVRAGAYKRVHVCSCVLVYVVSVGTVLLE